jgi:hypothetical protein
MRENVEECVDPSRRLGYFAAFGRRGICFARERVDG